VNKDIITLSFPAKPDYLLAVRLAVSGIAERIGFTVDDIEDIKVASAEACTLLLAAGRSVMDIRITAGDGIDIQLVAAGERVPAAEAAEGSELSQYLLEALVDTCTFHKEGETVTGVSFFKKI
jgi:anti-sigma regulatory factor (Ser/Thr protein kinase)